MLTTGARHPYKIDEKYLRSRKVELKSLNPSSAEEGGEGNKEGGASAIDFDPREISGYKLKELIWTDWRSEWEARPVSPSSIRLILLGRLVEDKVALKGEPHPIPAHISIPCTSPPCWPTWDRNGSPANTSIIA